MMMMGVGGAPSVTQRQDMRTSCRAISRPPIRDITLDKQKIFFFFLAVISSRWEGSACEEGSSGRGRPRCWSTGHFSQPINHLGSVCFVSFSPVLGFICRALKSNTLAPHTPSNAARSLTNTHKHLCALKSDSTTRSTCMCADAANKARSPRAYRCKQRWIRNASKSFPLFFMPSSHSWVRHLCNSKY